MQNDQRIENLQILGNNKRRWEKKKNEKGIPQENEKTTRKTKLYSRNLITGINAWAVFFVRYLGSFSKWTREEHLKNWPGNKKTYDDA